MGKPLTLFSEFRHLCIILLIETFNLSEQNWRRWVETVNCPAPQPESYSHDDDPGFHDDPELSIEYEDGVFYQESLDGSKVALLADHSGPLPSSTTDKKKASSRKGRANPANPSVPIPKGHRSTR